MRRSLRSVGVASLLAAGGGATGAMAAALAGAGCGSSPRGSADAGAMDAPMEAAPHALGLSIVSLSGAPLQAAPGDALPLKVVTRWSDGTSRDVPADQVKWTAPATVVATAPDASATPGVVPVPGAHPTAFFVANPFRTDRADYPGIVFVLDPGTAGEGALTVTASVAGGGEVSAPVALGPAPPGDPDAGALLYGQLQCANCHGMAAAGSPPVLQPDGSAVYVLHGSNFPYPAPGLDDRTVDGSPDLAADPAWSAAWLGVAAQGDIDNRGVALRAPMPDWVGKRVGDGGPVGAQAFADLYAYLRTLGP